MDLITIRSKAPYIKPYSLVTVKANGRTFTGEVMSYPILNSDKSLTAMVRTIPGHPGTLRELPVTAMRKYSRIRTILAARVILPWNNLGCLGFSCGNLYFDIFRKPYLGLYISYNGVKTWYRLPQLQELKREVI
jgi:hypothetical protein